MKKTLLMIPMMLVVAMASGCATSGDLAEVRAQEQMINAKADQALRDAQAAKAAADAAALRAEAAEARAENLQKDAEEKARIEEEKAERAAASAFQKSMYK